MTEQSLDGQLQCRWAGLRTHLQLQEEPPAVLPLVDAFKELPVVLVVLLQALELSLMQTQQLLGEDL